MPVPNSAEMGTLKSGAKDCMQSSRSAQDCSRRGGSCGSVACSMSSTRRPHHGKVSAHAIVGGLPIAAFDREDHRPVFAVRLGKAAEVVEFRPSKRRHALAGAAGEFGQIVAVRSGVDGGMEVVVGRDVADAVSRLDQGGGGLVRGAQGSAFRSRHGRGGPAGTNRFEFSHDGEHIVELPFRHVAHESAAMRSRQDEAAPFQLAQRFADRGPGHLKAGRDPHLVERRSRPEPAVGKCRRRAPDRSPAPSWCSRPTCRAGHERPPASMLRDIRCALDALRLAEEPLGRGAVRQLQRPDGERRRNARDEAAEALAR